MLTKSLAPDRAPSCAGGIGYGLTFSARREITKQEATVYARASKKAKGVILERLQVEIAWSRENARRQLNNALKRRGASAAVKHKPHPRSNGFDTVKVLQLVWLVANSPCGN